MLIPLNVTVGGVRCNEWFDRWQKAKIERRSRVRIGRGRGGAASTAARDRAQWNSWWAPAIGDALPQTVTTSDVADVLRNMEVRGRAPNTLRTHFLMVRALFNWLVDEGVLENIRSVSLRSGKTAHRLEVGRGNSLTTKSERMVEHIAAEVRLHDSSATFTLTVAGVP
jgi:hypothetical protein